MRRHVGSVGGRLNAEQQGELLDAIAAGRCPFLVCGNGGRVKRTVTWMVKSLTLPVALALKPTRAATLDVLVCEQHAGRPEA